MDKLVIVVISLVLVSTFLLSGCNTAGMAKYEVTPVFSSDGTVAYSIYIESGKDTKVGSVDVSRNIKTGDIKVTVEDLNTDASTPLAAYNELAKQQTKMLEIISPILVGN